MTEVIDALIAMIVIASFFQPTVQRAYAALSFSAVIIFYMEFFSHLRGLEYHVGSAVLAFGIIIILSGIDPVIKMAIHIQKACLAAILVNALGWYFYVAGISQVYANGLFIAIYLRILLALIIRNSDDMGGYTIAGLRSCFRYHWVARVYNYTKNGIKI